MRGIVSVLLGLVLAGVVVAGDKGAAAPQLEASML